MSRKCEYCEEDFDGYLTPLDKNGHLLVVNTPSEQYIAVNWYGHRVKIPIDYCPKCGKKLKDVWR